MKHRNILDTGHKKTVRIFEIVAEEIGVTTDQIISRNRTIKVVDARKICYYLLYEMEGWILKDVGYLMGRCIGSVCQGKNRIMDQRYYSPEMREKILKIERRLRYR